jgi:hypothetical protein
MQGKTNGNRSEMVDLEGKRRAKQKREHGRRVKETGGTRAAVVDSATLPVWELCSEAKVVSGDETKKEMLG